MFLQAETLLFLLFDAIRRCCVPCQDSYLLSVYHQMLPYCDVAHVTKIDHEYEADAYFPNLDEMDDWYIAADSDEQTYFDLEYQFLMYRRKK